VESKSGIWKVIAASSAGTLIEWYDFYIFGSLATVISASFFPKGNETVALLSTLATFATGFVVRPFGAIVFGRLGDLVGRKYAFLVTLLIMGGATFAIGLLPTYEQVGLLAPGLLLLLRLLQGLALGGEYGGAATYVAEHAPHGSRGFYTSFIQTTATLGLFVSIGVILICRSRLSPEEFQTWGWRIPFLLSIFLVLFSYYIRVRLQESPLFVQMKASGKGSKTPLRDSFGQWANLRLVLLALFGATAGQGVVWYTGQFYALFFVQKTLHVEFVQSNWIIAAALLAGTPFFILFGSLSDRIGRKGIIMAGCLLGVVSYLPLYIGMFDQADLAQKTLVAGSEVVQESQDHFGHARTTTRAYADGTTSREVVKTPLGGEAAKPERTLSVTLGNGPAMILSCLVLVQVLFVTMVYGPIAAFLVELFPTRIRYTSMSLPYHIGNGVFGGLVPFVATAMVAWMDSAYPGGAWNKYAGLFYPMLIASVTLVVGVFVLRERRRGEDWAQE
jgi:MHS family proline/betaine transporter-like MFS transporter